MSSVKKRGLSLQEHVRDLKILGRQTNAPENSVTAVLSTIK